MKRETVIKYFVNYVLWNIAKEQSHLFSFSHSKSSSTIRTATGPGEVDLVNALFEQEEDIWIRQGDLPSDAVRDKIIISCGDLLTFFVDHFALGKLTVFLHSLMSFYEVYLWQDNVFSAMNKPVTTVTELWDKIADSIMASAEDVHRLLLEKGLKGYIVLDGDAFVRLVSADAIYSSFSVDSEVAEDDQIVLYPDWQTFAGRKKLLDCIKSLHDGVIFLADNKHCSPSLFKKSFNENRSLIACDITLKGEKIRCQKEKKADYFESLSQFPLWNEALSKMMNCFSSSKNFFGEEDEGKDLKVNFQKYTSKFYVNFSFDFPYVENDCTLQIPNHIISLTLYGFSTQSLQIKGLNNRYPPCHSIITLAGGENLEDFNFFFDKFSAIYQSVLKLPENLPNLRSLGLLINVERIETDTYFPAISRCHNLQHLELHFFGNYAKKIILPELKKVRKLTITCEIVNPKNSEHNWIVEIKNAPFLEVIDVSCVKRNKIAENQKLKLSYTGCNKLKFIKNEYGWLTKFEPGEGVVLIPDDKEDNSLNTDSKCEVNNGVTHKRISYFRPQLSTFTMSPPTNAPWESLLVEADQPWKCLIMTEDLVDVRNLIWAVYDRVAYNPDSRLLTFHEFVPPLGNQAQVIRTDSALVKNQWLQGLKNGDSVGILRGPVSSGAWCLLPMQSPVQVDSRQQPCLFEIASHPPSVLTLLWHAELRRFYVKAIKSLMGTMTEVVYRYRVDEHYTHYL